MLETINVPLRGITSGGIGTFIGFGSGFPPPSWTVSSLPLNTRSSLSVQTFAFKKETPIPGSDLKLGEEIWADIERTDDAYVVRCGVLDEEAYGSSFQDAYIDFLTSLRDRYEVLSHRESRLAPPDRQILTRLRALLVRS